MALCITEDCINCGVCEAACPNNAIYKGGAEWNYAAGTTLSGTIETNGMPVDASEAQAALAKARYFIVPGKCTECVGFHEEPQCTAVCPENCCIPDPDFAESEEDLQSKVDWLHA